MVFHAPTVQVVEQRIECQVTTLRILLRRAEAHRVRNAATLGVCLAPQVDQVQPGAMNAQRRCLEVLALLRVRMDDAHS